MLYNLNFEINNELTKQINELDSFELEKLEAVIEFNGCYSNDDLSNLIDNLDSYEFYSDITLEEYAEQYIDECYELPEIALLYFDFEKFARDLSFEGYFEASNGVLYTY